MRLKPEIKAFIKETTHHLFPNADVYLFGSRVKDNARGGDIDILLLTDIKIDTKQLRNFRISFYKKFGWQKIDLVNFTKNESSAFKKLILKNALAL